MNDVSRLLAETMVPTPRPRPAAAGAEAQRGSLQKKLLAGEPLVLEELEFAAERQPRSTALGNVPEALAAGAAGTAASVPKALGAQLSSSDRIRREDARGMAGLPGSATQEAMQGMDWIKTQLARPDLTPAQRSAFTQARQRKLDRLQGIQRQTDPSQARRPEDQPLWKLGEAVQQGVENVAGAPDPARASEFGANVATGAGQFAVMIPAGIVGGAPAAVSLGMSQMGVAQYEDAVRHGAPVGDALLAGGLSSMLGTTEAIPVMGLINRMGAGNALLSVIKGAGEEAGQEFVQTIGENLIAAGIYDPERGAFDNTAMAAAVGGTLGGGAAAVLEAAARVKLKRGVTPSPEEQQALDVAAAARADQARAAVERPAAQPEPAPQPAPQQPAPPQPAAPAPAAAETAPENAGPAPENAPTVAPETAPETAPRPTPRPARGPVFPKAGVDLTDVPDDAFNDDGTVADPSKFNPEDLVELDPQTGQPRPFEAANAGPGRSPEPAPISAESRSNTQRRPADIGGQDSDVDPRVAQAADAFMAGAVDEGDIDSLRDEFDDADIQALGRQLNVPDTEPDAILATLRNNAGQDFGGGQALTERDPEAAQEREEEFARFAQSPEARTLTNLDEARSRLSTQPKAAIRRIVREITGKPVPRGQDPLDVVNAFLSASGDPAPSAQRLNFLIDRDIEANPRGSRRTANTAPAASSADLEQRLRNGDAVALAEAARPPRQGGLPAAEAKALAKRITGRTFKTKGDAIEAMGRFRRAQSGGQPSLRDRLQDDDVVDRIAQALGVDKETAVRVVADVEAKRSVDKDGDGVLTDAELRDASDEQLTRLQRSETGDNQRAVGAEIARRRDAKSAEETAEAEAETRGRARRGAGAVRAGANVPGHVRRVIERFHSQAPSDATIHVLVGSDLEQAPADIRTAVENAFAAQPDTAPEPAPESAPEPASEPAPTQPAEPSQVDLLIEKLAAFNETSEQRQELIQELQGVRSKKDMIRIAKTVVARSFKTRNDALVEIDRWMALQIRGRREGERVYNSTASAKAPNNSTYGAAIQVGPAEYVIYLPDNQGGDPSTTGGVAPFSRQPRMRQVEIALHELGHVYEIELFERAPAKIKRALRAEWKRANIQSNRDSLERGWPVKMRQDLMRFFSGPDGASGGRPLLDEAAPAYGMRKGAGDDVLAFSEWFANQVSRVLSTSDTAINAVAEGNGRWWAQLAKMWRRLATFLREMTGPNGETYTGPKIRNWLSEVGLDTRLTSERRSAADGSGVEVTRAPTGQSEFTPRRTAAQAADLADSAQTDFGRMTPEERARGRSGYARAAEVVDVRNPAAALSRLEAQSKRAQQQIVRELAGDGVKLPRDAAGRIAWAREQTTDENSAIDLNRAIDAVLGVAQEPTPSNNSQQASAGAVAEAVAADVVSALTEGRQLNGKSIMAVAREAGGPLSEGGYTVSDVYNGVELGLNQYLSDMEIGANEKEALELVQEVEALLPTQNRRGDTTDAFQQFSTPPAYAFAVNMLADLGANENSVLEPSAGNGGLAVWANRDARTTVVNEIDPGRRASLEALDFAEVLAEDAEQIGNLRPGEFDRVVMNPPFSAAGARGVKNTSAIGGRHIDQALQTLKPGGRLVAIVGHTFTPGNKRLKSFWKRVEAGHQIRAIVRVKGDKIYRKMGTTYDTIVLVIDKTGAPNDRTETVTASVDTLEGLIDATTTIRTALPARTPSGENAGEGGRRPARGGRRASNLPGRGERGAPTPGAGEAAGAVRGGRRSGARDDGSAAGSQDAAGLSGVDGERSAELRGEPRAAPERLTGSRRNRDSIETQGSFSGYAPSSVMIDGAKPHPAPLVESNAMASVSLPDTEYRPTLRPGDLDNLSEAQLENVIYAGAAHAETLESGKRRGYFVGDGTGVGKGRTIAGVILDNANQGRRRAVWVSKNRALFNDAKRDLDDVGVDLDVIDGREAKAFLGDVKEGVFYTTYDGLKAKGTKDTRIDGEEFPHIARLVRALGKDFDGVIAFDEAHGMANAVDAKGERGVKKASAKARAGLALQDALPNARILYVSATGATEVTNLGYLDRLGLWGDGTAFSSRSEFLSKIEEGGVAAMELVARDLKQLGSYLARSISYDGVEYAPLVHPLTPDQRATYNDAAEAWTTVSNNIDDVIDVLMPGADAAEKRTKRGQISSVFWGAHQRFFNTVLTSMQMPSVLKQIAQDLDAGMAPVIQLTNTGEAAQKKSLNQLEEGDTLEDLDVTPRRVIMELVENAFPVEQMEQYVPAGETEPVWRVALDSQGEPILNQEAVAARDALLDRLAGLAMPDAPLDMIMEEFGADTVAEITGRTERVVRQDGKRVRQRRSPKVRDQEAKEFNEGKRDILVFSEAGGTGQSYHASNTIQNKKRRAHYILQAGWRADSAVQGFGRTHRSNQASAPIYRLVQTDLAGHKRFVSTIARRLDQLGALTKGQRDTSSSGLFSATDNLESPQAKAALAKLLNDIVAGDDTAPLSKDAFAEITGLNLNKDVNNIAISQFLNRLMAMPVETQDAVFEAFVERLEEETERARQAGELDAGLETVKAESVEIVEDVVVNTDEKSGAETRYLRMKLAVATDPVAFDLPLRRDGVEFFSTTDGETGLPQTLAVVPAPPRTQSNGRVERRVRIIGPLKTDNKTISEEKWGEVSGQYKRIDDMDAARDAWGDAQAASPKTRTITKHMLTGALLPVYNRLPQGGKALVERVVLADGTNYLGRILNQRDVKKTLARFDYAPSGQAAEKGPTPGQIFAAVMDGARVNLERDASLQRRAVGGEQRVEYRVPRRETVGRSFAPDMRAKGFQVERVGYETRVFVPDTPAGRNAIQALLRDRSIESVVNDRAEEVDLAEYGPETQSRTLGLAMAPNPGTPSVNVYGALAANTARLMNNAPIGTAPPPTVKRRRLTPRELLDGAFDRWRQTLQDYFLPQKRLEASIEEDLGGPLPDEMKAYRAEELMSGRIGNQIDRLEYDYFRPMVEAMREGQLSLDDVGLYLTARHDAERRRQTGQTIATGLTPQEVADILAWARGLDAPGRAALSRVVRLHDRLNRQTMRLRVNAGLLSRETAEIWRKTYRRYTNLSGFNELDGNARDALDPEGRELLDRVNGMLATGGSKLTVKGPESRGARGRKSRSFNPLVNVMVTAQEAVVRAEKNQVLRALYEIADAGVAEDVVERVKPKVIQVFNPVTGLPEFYSRPAPESQDMVTVKIEGRERRIRIKNPRLLEAYKKLGPQGMTGLIRASGFISQWVSKANTMFNPEFLVVNAARDLQTAGVNLQKEQIRGITLAAARDWRAALMGAWRGLGENNAPPTDARFWQSIANGTSMQAADWARAFREYDEAGGRIAFFNMENKVDFRERVLRDLGDFRGAPASAAYRRTGVRAAVQVIERMNLSVDNAVRLAVFAHARREGVSVEDAASLAKNLTVNFNRRGLIGQQMNAIFVFFNAAIQGGQIMLSAMHNRRVQMILAGATGLGATLAMLGGLLSPEDDDGENLYDKLQRTSPHLFERYLVIPNPWAKEAEDHFKIPLPYGYNIFPEFGRVMVGQARGVMTPRQGLEQMAGATVSAFVPVDLGRFAGVMPTAIQPFAEIATNTNFAGRPIASEFQQDLPAHRRHGDYVAEPYVVAADLMNRVTGGDRYTEGLLSVSPEHVEHLGEWAIGGFGRFFSRGGRLADKLLSGEIEDVKPFDVPFFRHVYGRYDIYHDRSLFWDRAALTRKARERNELRADDDATPSPADTRIATLASLKVLEGRRTPAVVQSAFDAGNRALEELGAKPSRGASLAGYPSSIINRVVRYAADARQALEDDKSLKGPDRVRERDRINAIERRALIAFHRAYTAATRPRNVKPIPANEDFPPLAEAG